MPLQNPLMILPQSMGVGEAICTRHEVVAVVNRPQDIEDDEAMSFFGGSEGDADESQGRPVHAKGPGACPGPASLSGWERVHKSGGGGSKFLDSHLFFRAIPIF